MLRWTHVYVPNVPRRKSFWCFDSPAEEEENKERLGLHETDEFLVDRCGPHPHITIKYKISSIDWGYGTQSNISLGFLPLASNGSRCIRTCTQIVCDKGELYLTGTLVCNHSDCCSSIDETNKKEHFSVLFAKCVLLHMVGKGELEQTIDEEH